METRFRGFSLRNAHQRQYNIFEAKLTGGSGVEDYHQGQLAAHIRYQKQAIDLWYTACAMAIKNYTSDKPIDRIFAELQQTLGAHGAKQIAYDYGDDGKVHGIQFVIKVNDRFIPIKLPARVEQAQAVLKRQYENGEIKSHIGTKVYSYDQAYRVAWRNILDWVQAQMALLEIGMAKMEEVFLPYMLDRQGVTYFERMEQQGFLLGDGKAA